MVGVVTSNYWKIVRTSRRMAMTVPFSFNLITLAPTFILSIRYISKRLQTFFLCTHRRSILHPSSATHMCRRISRRVLLLSLLWNNSRAKRFRGPPNKNLTLCSIPIQLSKFRVSCSEQEYLITRICVKAPWSHFGARHNLFTL